MNAASAVETEVRRIRELLKMRRFAEGLRAADALLVTVPENRDVLYLRRPSAMRSHATASRPQNL